MRRGSPCGGVAREEFDGKVGKNCVPVGVDGSHSFSRTEGRIAGHAAVDLVDGFGRRSWRRSGAMLSSMVRLLATVVRSA